MGLCPAGLYRRSASALPPERSFDALVSPKFQTLSGAHLKVAARGCAHGIDRARVCIVLGAQVYAAAVVPGGEADLAKMAGLHRSSEIFALNFPPAQQVGLRHENAAVMTAAAASPTLEAVELRVGDGLLIDCHRGS